MSLSKIKRFFNLKIFFPELLSTNEKFLFDLRNRLTNGERNLNEIETKKLFTNRKFFNNDIFLTGLKNHVLKFEYFKNRILMNIFGLESKKTGFSLINFLVYIFLLIE